MSSSLARTVRNFWRSGYKRAFRQIAQMNDTKSGELVGVDDFGNHFYETKNPEEIHMRTRWVEYKDFWRPDASQLEPGWHYWLAYGTDTRPNQLRPDQVAVRHVIDKKHPINYSGTRGAYISYNTAKPKFATWESKVKTRA
ncbi:DEKNAAC101390 [Brettanomyces naardenensis]|uniref:NADH dehydrogenase [ubiquinone] 1 alpha subcomplex subunit n=1 Tax=Brettanomyces naardenensis TaxID=13370 RepID=A0A448YHM8_BRENA|nr:DEKNAAC101390 [Brettanomyces naardenensis]